ncbi:hypothetical protein PoB_001241300 [Plakobranchus ocellatus]|uniref:Uncharacterized protein n=1 Tax=Plakobranchus ocellatus TaxID=259542 RepID=A0AAV3YTP0_9GAST|nr:hypothetical protein PoB_001241300 [Plakobranchus ocellatus]
MELRSGTTVRPAVDYFPANAYRDPYNLYTPLKVSSLKITKPFKCLVMREVTVAMSEAEKYTIKNNKVDFTPFIDPVKKVGEAAAKETRAWLEERQSNTSQANKEVLCRLAVTCAGSTSTLERRRCYRMFGVYHVIDVGYRRIVTAFAQHQDITSIPAGLVFIACE